MPLGLHLPLGLHVLTYPRSPKICCKNTPHLIPPLCRDAETDAAIKGWKPEAGSDADSDEAADDDGTFAAIRRRLTGKATEEELPENDYDEAAAPVAASGGDEDSDGEDGDGSGGEEYDPVALKESRDKVCDDGCARLPGLFCRVLVSGVLLVRKLGVVTYKHSYTEAISRQGSCLYQHSVRHLLPTQGGGCCVDSDERPGNVSPCYFSYFRYIQCT